MKKEIKSLAKDLTPPVLFRWINRQRRVGIRFSHSYKNWEEAKAASTGYDDPAILEKIAEAALKVKRGEAVYERDSVVFNSIDYSWPLLAGLTWAAARHHGKLHVLDF